ncbi:MAG TPA: PQQ-dependent sugar dehydrogenase [Thermoanaerobaculia bacterium]|nr:PQQ-dependent sugar dehydrogenase [Thermoanaerobaculia bacterium]
MKRLAVAIAFLFAALSSPAQTNALREIANGLSMPVGIAHTKDSRLFIVTQPGAIFIFDGSELLPTPFLDIQSDVVCCGEAGLLGLAFHPHYKENGYFFISYVALSGDLIVARYSVSADRDVADPGSRTILMEIPHRDAPIHFGGALAFGPDGYLYIGTGDGTNVKQLPTNAQNLASLLGKVLRIDVDHLPDLVPPTNPLVGRTDARGEIWAYGLRNPWRISFDRATGDLWIADVGQDVWEEIDVQPATSRGGENYGWEELEGTGCNAGDCSPAGTVEPVLTYGHDAGACAITGGYRYRGSAIPELAGLYIYADFCTGTISAAQPFAGSEWLPRQLFNTRFLVSSFGEDRNGELYVIDYGGGAVYKIEDARGPRLRVFAPRL